MRLAETREAICTSSLVRNLLTIHMFRQHLSHSLHQRFFGKWLGQIAICPLAQPPALIKRSILGTHHDDGEVAFRVQRSQLAAYTVAANSRQDNIEYDTMRAFHESLSYALIPIGCSYYIAPGICQGASH